MDQKNRGRLAVITGATSGIGRAFSQEFAQQGYHLLLIGRRGEILLPLAERLEKEHGIQAETMLLELTKEEDVAALEDRVRALYPDVLVNNAGFGVKGMGWEMDALQIRSMLRLHGECVARLSAAALEGMRRRGRGVLINVASDAAYTIVPGNALYSGTKAFIKQFTEGLFLDLRAGHSGVQVQALCPGLTKTDFQLKMGMDPEKRKNHGLLRWQEPGQVVEQSLQALRRGKPVCICGGWRGRMEYLLGTRLPKGLYYRLVLKLFAPPR